MWALKALEMVAKFLPRAVADTSDDEARSHMLLASSIAGIGFGNAGVHLPHGMSYPVAGMVKSFRPAGYASDHPLVPHGMAVILHTPAVVRFTAPADPERHLKAAAALGAEVGRAAPAAPSDLAAAGKILADRVIHFMRLLKMPNGLSAIGYTPADISALVAGTLPQHRVTKLSPRPAGEAELTELFRASMQVWPTPA
jgi:hydroxyacid-oxoacid transhydrogenase